MTPLTWSLLAAIFAVGAEYLYRTLPGLDTLRGWAGYLYLWMPLQLGIGFCICRLVRTPGTPLIGALIIWSFAVIGARVFVSVVMLRDQISPGTWLALGLMIAARIAQSTWK